MNYNIDLQNIADQLDFDLEDVEMLMGLFLDTAKESLSKMEQGIVNHNFEDIFISAHSIKGSALNLTLTDISQIAQNIEIEARAKNKIDYLEQYKLLDTMISDIKILN